MKTILCLTLLAFLIVHAEPAHASAKRLARKVATSAAKRQLSNKEAISEQAPPPPPPPAPAEPPPPSAAQQPPPGSPPPQAVVTNRPALKLQKSQDEKAAQDKKTIAFQRQRAMSGQASAQYDLGVRYLKGDGLDQNDEEARRWISMAAQQNYSLAVKKLEELDKAKK